MPTAQEIGQHLSRLRERADLKQNALAKQLEWSAALLSRIESGERPPTDDELETILTGIGTPEATDALAVLRRQWTALPEPSLDDPDRDLLWEAELATGQVKELAERPDVKQFFERRLVRYREELELAASKVRNKRYRIALMGTIAVGKSTAICRAEGLELPSAKGMPKPVLETGAGGITICEVHLKRGPGYGVLVEPCPDEEVRRQVTELAGFLLNPSQAASADLGDDVEGGSPGISREVERALRNMASIKRRRAERRPDGTVVPSWDEARDLAQAHPDVKALSVELLSRMKLHSRDRRDLWYSDASGMPPLEWLQRAFEEINNGKHAEFGLPKRIELVVPLPVLGDDRLDATLIDTQGVDDVAERADLEQHFDDSHTAVVLCSVFNEAPATAVRQLLTRAREAGVRTIRSHCAVLVLPRPNEALAVKDNGVPVELPEEGYALKGEEVELRLHPLGLGGMSVEFFNSADDDPVKLRDFLVGRIRSIRDYHRERLKEVIGGARALLDNYEKEQAQEAMREAARQLSVWLTHNSMLGSPSRMRVRDSLITATKAAHVKTIYASVIRDGDWPNLDYAHQLSHGARRIAASMVEPRLTGFREVATNMLNDDRFSDAHDLVRQTLRALESGFDALIRKTQLVGQSVYSDEMRSDLEFWRACHQEWGRGRGYRDRVAKHNCDWFDEADHTDGDQRVVELVKVEWDACMAALKDLLKTD